MSKSILFSLVGYFILKNIGCSDIFFTFAAASGCTVPQQLSGCGAVG
jgi:hypothetical protein